VGLVARHAFLIVICLAALYPLWFIVTTALKTNADYQLDPTGFPAHPTLDSLRTMVSDEPLPRWMWNSLLVTVSSVAVSTLVALLAAYAAVFGRFRGHKIFLSTSVALMVVPPVTLLVPMFVFMVAFMLTMPPATAGALTPFPDIAGSAASLLSFCQFVVASSAALVVGSSFDGTARPMALTIGVASVAAFVAFRVVDRGISR